MTKKAAKKASINFLKLVQIFLLGLLPVLLVVGTILSAIEKKKNELRPQDFTTKITNKYFTLPPGKTFVYEARTDEGLERDEITVTGETKQVAGITTLVMYDKVYLNGVLIEDTRDYIAQHKNGDVWYFGEDVDNYDKTGKFLSHEGAWLAGVNDGIAGIWVKENPELGKTYRQEYLKGEAEDMVTVLSLDETVEVRGKTYTGCLKTKDWTPLNPAALENKYYCPEVGNVVLEVDLADGERVEFVAVK